MYRSYSNRISLTQKCIPDLSGNSSDNNYKWLVYILLWTYLEKQHCIPSNMLYVLYSYIFKILPFSIFIPKICGLSFGLLFGVCIINLRFLSKSLKIMPCPPSSSNKKLSPSLCAINYYVKIFNLTRNRYMYISTILSKCTYKLKPTEAVVFKHIKPEFTI